VGIEDPGSLRRRARQSTRSHTPPSARRAGVALALTEDFCNFERIGLVMQRTTKMRLYYRGASTATLRSFHRPMTDSGAHVWISFSPDLRNWGVTTHAPGPQGGWWDANKVGLSPPLIETPEGG